MLIKTRLQRKNSQPSRVGQSSLLGTQSMLQKVHHAVIWSWWLCPFSTSNHLFDKQTAVVIFSLYSLLSPTIIARATCLLFRTCFFLNIGKFPYENFFFASTKQSPRSTLYPSSRFPRVSFPTRGTLDAIFPSAPHPFPFGYQHQKLFHHRSSKSIFSPWLLPLANLIRDRRLLSLKTLIDSSLDIGWHGKLYIHLKYLSTMLLTVSTEKSASSTSDVNHSLSPCYSRAKSRIYSKSSH